ncbi:DUF4041 domain-containing protein [Sporolactobacillus terrae]|uniref:DUF4041 domain-containing protein n=1 Tax=Sporolactobacillus terrae TaxID=269673 RepID=UPI0009E077DD|nr:DUF4041 domain-containing protein [Sporolactobacillus terrae]
MQFKDKWYYSTWFIALLFAFWFVFIPLVIGVVLLIVQMKNRHRMFKEAGLFELESVSKNIDNKQKLLDKLEKDRMSLTSNISEKEKNLSEIQKNIKSITDTLKNLESEKKDEIKIIKQINAEKEQLEKLKKENRTLLDQIDENEKTLHSFNLAQEEIESSKIQLDELKKQIIETNDEILNQSFGFYEPRYKFENSEQYQEKLKEIRHKQKDMARSKVAVTYSDEITLDGSIQKGRAFTNDNIRLALRAFNSECDSSIAKVKFNNVPSCEKRINAAFKAINKANVRNTVQIKDEYKALKYDELYLAYEYEQKKEEEKEEQRRLKEQMREEAKVQKEIEREKKKIEKEEKHFNQELERLRNEAQSAEGESKLNLINKIEELETEVQELAKDKENVFNREKNTRAGYVYIISNIGSFGEDVYKIGLTRRLDPTERVKELGDASVPFSFDIHATIFSDDAPGLEAALHRTFDDRRLNKINTRKEFFRVTLAEIKAVVEKNHNKTVEYTKLAEAQEYRQSLAIEKKQKAEQTAS